MPVFASHGEVRLCELSPLHLAYIGDSVYDLLVRGSLLGSRMRMHQMHLAAVRRVKAAAQAQTLEKLMPFLQEEEVDYVRRGRNAHGHHPAPRSASTADYAAATGLECMLGYLYVTGQEDRINELYSLSLRAADQQAD